MRVAFLCALICTALLTPGCGQESNSSGDDLEAAQNTSRESSLDDHLTKLLDATQAEVTKIKAMLEALDSKVRGISEKENEKAVAARQTMASHMRYMGIKPEHDAIEVQYKISLEELEKAEREGAPVQQVESLRAGVERHKKHFESLQQELAGLKPGDEILFNAQFKAAQENTRALNSCLKTAKTAHQKAVQAQKNY